MKTIVISEVPDITMEVDYTLCKAGVFQFFCAIGLNNFGWHRELKKNKAFNKRLDRPFL